MLHRKDGALWRPDMKMLVTVFVLATLAATPAVAKQHRAISPQAAAAQASVPYDTADPYVVIVNRQVVGRDPDANVRLMLRRDPGPDGN
jgi:hypothetical protein